MGLLWGRTYEEPSALCRLQKLLLPYSFLVVSQKQFFCCGAAVEGGREGEREQGEGKGG